LLLTLALASTVSCAQPTAPYPHGDLRRINGYLVLHVAGTPRQMGEQHGRLLKAEVQRMVDDLIVRGEGGRESYSYQRLLEGSRVMERFLLPEFREELHALAEAAEVDCDELVAAQLFGDVWGAQYCTSFAVFGPATRTGECIVGRNMDYWDNGVSQYAAVLIHFTPDRGRPFFTVSWAGIINGWTAMNDHGLCVSNNIGYGAKSESLEGLSTCFMLRKVAQFAQTVEEGVRIIEEGPRAIGTNMMVAGGHPPNAAVVEYDHAEAVARWAKDGYVMADNSFRRLYREEPDDEEGFSSYSRYGTLLKLIREHYGQIDETMNFAAAPGVPITSINLHSALLFPQSGRFRVSMGKVPACEQPYRRFRMTAEGIISDEPAGGKSEPSRLRLRNDAET